MKSIILIFMLLLYSSIFAQKKEINNNKTSSYGLVFLPTKSANSYGIQIGLIGSEALCDFPYTKKSYGLNIQIPGQGFLQLLNLNNNPFKISNKNSQDIELINKKSIKRSFHNGVVLSLTGTFTEQINGVSISGMVGRGLIMNGVSANIFWNLYAQTNGVVLGSYNYTLQSKGLQIGFVNKTNTMKGLQIGLYNKATQLKGFQIGLWNRNVKRSLPIINWSF